MQEKIPLVSVVLPVHNEARWLRSCLESLLTQDHPAVEIVIVDDASHDNSLDIVAQFQKNHPNIISHRFESNQGEGPVRTQGISMSSGEFIIQTDADAIFPPEFISRSLEYLTTHAAIAASIGYLLVHPERQGILADYWRAKRHVSYTLRKSGKKPGVIGVYIFHRSILDQIAPYQRVPLGTDYDFALRINQAGITPVWAEDVFFWHADVSDFKPFFMRLFNGARHMMPILKRWNQWLSPIHQWVVIAQNSLVVLLWSSIILTPWSSWFFIGPIVAFSIEGFGPIMLHRETREIMNYCFKKKYYKTILALPLITWLRVRAGSFGKLYAILFPKKVAAAITFDVDDQ